MALQVVTGSRVDLVQVNSDMKAVFQAPTELIRVQREMTPFKAAWKRFAYAEAARGFAEIAMPQNARLRAELQIWRDLSRAFDAWDRFDHVQALGIIENYSQRIGQCQPRLRVALKILNDENMRTFSETWSDEAFVQQVAAQMPWFHSCTLLDKVSDQDMRVWYV